MDFIDRNELPLLAFELPSLTARSDLSKSDPAAATRRMSWRLRASGSSLATRDPYADAAFYRALFGYEIFDLASDDGSEHVLLSSDGYARASANPLPGDVTKQHPHWLNFIRVVSTTDTVARVAASGGRVLMQPYPDRHGGLVAVVADPAGAPFGLLEWTDTDTKEGAQ